DAPGFRHPVVLYDGLKNLLLIPVLLLIRKSKPRPGIVTAYFIFLYAFFRLFVDLFRDYPTSLWGLATGQSLNLIMTFTGAAMLFILSRKPSDSPILTPQMAAPNESHLQIWMKRVVFAVLLAFSLILPSDWTQDIPQRYGKRHPDMEYSRLYPKLQ
ncbi:MAG TPA: prolipoprotein diacylglyceryl transferase family protein, partial [Acidobacteriota bacterium]|nr:prolipoprotein diacylglyceryl transferase family protein [Acidobacteriota bacterium]